MKEIRLGRCKPENAKIMEYYGNKSLVCGEKHIAQISPLGYLYVNLENLNKRNSVYLQKFWDSYKDKVYKGRPYLTVSAANILKDIDFYKNKRFDLQSGFWRKFK